MPILLARTPSAPASRRNDRWSFTLYPDPAEGGGCFRSSRPDTPEYVLPGLAADPARAALVAARRARSKLRCYAAANRLNRLRTLTYAGEGCHDPLALRANLAAFFRSLRMELGGQPLPYVWVPEWHKTVHGLHAYFAVNRFIKRSVIEHAWGRGFVHIKMLGDLKSAPVPLQRPAARQGTCPSTSRRHLMNPVSVPLASTGTTLRRSSSPWLSTSAVLRLKGCSIRPPITSGPSRSGPGLRPRSRTGTPHPR